MLPLTMMIMLIIIIIIIFKSTVAASGQEKFSQLTSLLGNFVVQIHPQEVLNPLKTKRRLLYLRTQSVPRCKHFSSRL